MYELPCFKNQLTCNPDFCCAGLGLFGAGLPFVYIFHPLGAGFALLGAGFAFLSAGFALLGEREKD